MNYYFKDCLLCKKKKKILLRKSDGFFAEILVIQNVAICLASKKVSMEGELPFNKNVWQQDLIFWKWRCERKCFFQRIFSLEGDLLFEEEYQNMMFCLKDHCYVAMSWEERCYLKRKILLKVSLAIGKAFHTKICLWNHVFFEILTI